MAARRGRVSMGGYCGMLATDTRVNGGSSPCGGSREPEFSPDNTADLKKINRGRVLNGNSVSLRQFFFHHPFELDRILS